MTSNSIIAGILILFVLLALWTFVIKPKRDAKRPPRPGVPNPGGDHRGDPGDLRRK